MLDKLAKTIVEKCEQGVFGSENDVVELLITLEQIGYRNSSLLQALFKCLGGSVNGEKDQTLVELPLNRLHQVLFSFAHLDP